MISYTNLDFYMRVLCLVSLICIENIFGIEWKSTYFESYYNLTSLPNSMFLDETLVSDQSTATTVMSCSLFCAKKERSSLYYNQHEMNCYCNNDIDTRLTHMDPTDPGETDYQNGVGETDDDPSEIVYGNYVASLNVSTNSSTPKYDIQPYKENCLALYDFGYKTNAVYTVQPIEGAIQDVFCDMDTLERALDVGADDCLQWLQLGYAYDGVYNIRLSNGTTVRAWCNQIGGGWTVIQRRQDGSVGFYRNWAAYVNGFGDAAGEYWLGLEAIYLLSQQQSSLHIDMESFDEEPPLKLTAFASYSDFSLTSASDKYRLSIGAFGGDCGDSLTYHDQQRFSTLDSDNDQSSSNCASLATGGWWYKACIHSNLNGEYHGGHYTGNVNGMNWYTCWGRWYSVKACSMGIKRS